MKGWSDVPFADATLKAIRAELERIEPHEHFEGMNECSVCDENIGDAILRHLKEVLATPRGAMKTFKAAWAAKKAEGYQYGRDALEGVRFGWDLHAAESAAEMARLRAELAKVSAAYAKLYRREADSDFSEPCPKCGGKGAKPRQLRTGGTGFTRCRACAGTGVEGCFAPGKASSP